MPLYEYICQSCDGVFELLRSLREATEPAPCPLCDRECPRIMPTSFAAFSYRDGYNRRLPDRGTYWHLGKEVKHQNTGGVPAFEHPELYDPSPPKLRTKAEEDGIQELDLLEQRSLDMMTDAGIKPSTGKGGKPNAKPLLAADGHVSDRDIREAKRAREGKR
jgi:putative FmdB family regulatory protein